MFKLKVKTNQEAFDAVRVHLSKMKRQSIRTGTNMCLYAGPKGARCAISAIIDAPWKGVKALDDQESPAIGTLINKGLVLSGNVKPNLLSDLQMVHDNASNWDPEIGFCGEPTLETVAMHHGLSFRPLEELLAVK